MDWRSNYTDRYSSQNLDKLDKFQIGQFAVEIHAEGSSVDLRARCQQEVSSKVGIAIELLS